MGSFQLDDRGIVVPCPSCGQKNRRAYDRLGETTRCATCKEPLPEIAEPVEIPSMAAFDTLIAQASFPVVVDYWAPWCAPCRMVAPELDTLAAQAAGRLLIVKVNTDALPDLGERHQVMSIPTMAVFEGGHEVARTSGARPAAAIDAFVRQAVGR